jgi:hypothetical protein
LSALQVLLKIVLCGASFGAMGGGLGYALGSGAPSYYRGVFHAVDKPGFSPHQVGFGLGVTQGFVGGLAIGSVVTLATAIAGPRLQAYESKRLPPEAVELTRLRWSWSRRILVIITVLIASVGSFTLGGIFGAINAESMLYREISDLKIAKIRPILQDSQFRGMTAEEQPAGRVELIGGVDTEQAYADITERISFLFGKEEAQDMLEKVEVRGE